VNESPSYNGEGQKNRSNTCQQQIFVVGQTSPGDYKKNEAKKENQHSTKMILTEG
jgi:hypothetical protein